MTKFAELKKKRNAFSLRKPLNLWAKHGVLARIANILISS
jgi:hypothetical protein